MEKKGKRINTVEIKPVRKVCITDTLRLIPVGKTAVFSCEQLGEATRVRVAKSNLKKEGIMLDLKVLDFGRRYEITRL